MRCGRLLRGRDRSVRGIETKMGDEKGKEFVGASVRGSNCIDSLLLRRVGG